MADVFASLEPHVRRDVQRLADVNGVSPEALMPEIITAYVRLLRDVPEALPRNPLAPLVERARSRVQP
ncbi:hypothetical protein [Falsihalocynthiibacter arcticus]|uniref:hypothetical protein n=1 Tax=Falsihalocynthiibacter arcticus TaxID=1579316 RepID=UPI003001F63E